eukprot:TRINITY_DN1727_c0_g1_i2.p1 TRINITY_DN1727_c0_g1~~TRINITY_DN1727_c0_g1_i2.p1  ORF type:complete len:432 (-),score=87.28 TRINITY_DN1727_c0_g1_i2:9-1304(-)
MNNKPGTSNAGPLSPRGFNANVNVGGGAKVGGGVVGGGVKSPGFVKQTGPGPEDVSDAAASVAAMKSAPGGSKYLAITIVSASGLTAADYCGTSDPYTVVTLNSTSWKTRTIKKNLNPNWNDTLAFVLPTDWNSSVLQIAVWDWDKFSQGDELGEIDFPLSEISSISTDEARGFTMDIQGLAGMDQNLASATGKITVVLSIHDRPFNIEPSPAIFAPHATAIKSTASFSKFTANPSTKKIVNVKAAAPQQPQQPINNNNNNNNNQKFTANLIGKTGGITKPRSKTTITTVSPTPSGKSTWIAVTVGNAKGLRPADIGVNEKTSDPFTEIKMGGQTYKTQVINKNLDPVWNETFLFESKDWKREVLEADVYDLDSYSKNDRLGSTSIRLGDLHLEADKPRNLVHDLTVGGSVYRYSKVKYHYSERYFTYLIR